jgi:hypothetical protein
MGSRIEKKTKGEKGAQRTIRNYGLSEEKVELKGLEKVARRERIVRIKHKCTQLRKM